MKCCVCEKIKDDVQDYRNKPSFAMGIMIAHPHLVFLDGPLEVCQQCLDHAKQLCFLPCVASPNTSVDSYSSIDCETDDSTNIQPPIILPIPENVKEIFARFPHDPMKRYRLRQLLKQAMPLSVRNRKFKEIVDVDEGPELEQEANVKALCQKEFRNQNANLPRTSQEQSLNSSGVSSVLVPSFDDNLTRSVSVISPARSSDQAHSNMAAPLRPTIPYYEATPPSNMRLLKDIKGG